ncbi:MAG: hemerythrin family protein [Vicinamibacterales bacterium]|nr:hemerythrin family protein [Vicinamibacterales bacterium]
MVLLEWTDNLALHVDEIDRQHQELLAIVNDLGAALADGRDRESVSWALAALSACSLCHFDFEDALLEGQGCPGAHERTLKQRIFVRTLGEFRASYARGQVGLSMTVMDFLAGWLKDHVTGADQRDVARRADTAAA